MNHAQRKVDAAQIRTGDLVMLAGWPPAHFEVIDASDPALLIVRAPTGRELKVGRQAVSIVTPQPEEKRQ